MQIKPALSTSNTLQKHTKNIRMKPFINNNIARDIEALTISTVKYNTTTSSKNKAYM